MILPFVRDLFLELEGSAPFGALAAAIANSRALVRCGGLTDTARILHTVLLARATNRPVLLVTATNKSAEALFDTLRTFQEFVAPHAPVPMLLPAHDLIPSDELSPHPDISEKRAIALWKMARRQATPVTSIVVAPIGALAMRLEPPSFYANLSLTLRRNDAIDMELLVTHLESAGYERREPVEMVGQFSVRGGIVDVFSPEAARPVRLELFGDEVESIREFDPGTQRSVQPRQETTFLPLTDFPLRRELLAQLNETKSDSSEPFPGCEFLLPLVTPFNHTTFDLLADPGRPDPLIVMDEPVAIWTAFDHLWARLDADPDPRLPSEKLYLHREALDELLARQRRVEMEHLAMPRELENETVVEFASQPSPKFHGNIPMLVEDLRRRITQNTRTVFLAPTTGDAERLADIFKEYAVPFQIGTGQMRPGQDGYLEEKAYIAEELTPAVILKGIVAEGVTLPESRLAIVGNHDLFDLSPAVAAPPSRTRAKSGVNLATFLGDFRDLQPGDYVVHVQHGIARYHGLKEINTITGADGSGPGEFMQLEFAEEARLYVPLTRLDLVQKYHGLGDSGLAPKLDRLGGVAWEKTRARVKKGMLDMADDLLKLYAERKVGGGHAFSPDSPWQREFEDTFEFSETADQDAAIAQVKKDMESEQPMDRLLCGDVGYGKTEVAMRAAMKAITDHKQVAVLAPTTVLCFQHYETFKQRFSAFPVKVDMLSRFRDAKQIKKSIEEIEAGKIDLVVGTHRLLSKDVVFRDLGLLVVDEEQRFGVGAKERIKQMRKQVDVLSMSATPIPRTLHMSLVGLRDMSVIETPPKDRLAIQTVVAPFSENLIRTALEQELARGGQAYFVHNRVDNIWEIAAMIQRLIPRVRILVGHGQMDEKQLEKVMFGFVRHEADILVSTTIIENGLDIPLCNTMIVNRADRMGLSELYQLRGRVGRSNRRAYAYLLTPDHGELTPLARRRLSALKEFSDLGAGFKIAALDLELRGAGTLLGGQQSGHVEAVGFDMYCQMLERTVRELKGEEVAPEISTTINLGLNLRIPDDYISEENQRLRVYKRIAGVTSLEESAAVEKELSDRYGEPPEQVLHLLDYSMIKALAAKLSIRKIERRRGEVQMQFHEAAIADPQRLMDLVARRPGAQFTPSGVLHVPLEDRPVAGILLEVKAILEALG
jgi:transcription-repair coupling factor (superfamily II helicase)